MFFSHQTENIQKLNNTFCGLGCEGTGLRTGLSSSERHILFPKYHSSLKGKWAPRRNGHFKVSGEVQDEQNEPEIALGPKNKKVLKIMMTAYQKDTDTTLKGLRLAKSIIIWAWKEVRLNNRLWDTE